MGGNRSTTASHAGACFRIPTRMRPRVRDTMVPSAITLEAILRELGQTDWSDIIKTSLPLPHSVMGVKYMPPSTAVPTALQVQLLKTYCGVVGFSCRHPWLNTPSTLAQMTMARHSLLKHQTMHTVNQIHIDQIESVKMQSC